MSFRQSLANLICGVSQEASPEELPRLPSNPIEEDGLPPVIPLRRARTTGSVPNNRPTPKLGPPRRQTFSGKISGSIQSSQFLNSIPFIHWGRENNENMTTLKGIRRIFRDEEIELFNTRDAKTYTWIPLSTINRIIRNDKNVVKALEEKIVMHESMKRFVFEHAKRLVSLLIYRNRLHLLQLFYSEQFGDEHFPIKFIKPRTSSKKSRLRWSIQSCRSNKTISVLAPPDGDISDDDDDQDEDAMKQFCRIYQWYFFVPVFSPQDSAHIFDPSCQMPYLEELGSNQTNFSVVRHFVIHRKHLNFKLDDQIGTLVDDDRNPHIAVKELLSAQGLTREKFHEVAENEATILTRLKDQDHPHFIRAIATYTQGSRHYFVFPWARGGNLRDFWTNQPNLSLEAEHVATQDWSGYYKWFFKQLLGLSSAIEDLHHPKKDPQQSCRHGDLKPENILCFSGTEIGKQLIPIGVHLVVADAGHAKVHEKATELRHEATSTPQGTRMYSPPEAELRIHEARSRRYDIWSLGCLYLEFLIWMLYGNATLEYFRRDIGSGQPYYRKEPEVGLKDSVKKWIKAIEEDPRCVPTRETAIGRLVNLIENRMLVVKAEVRRDSFTQASGSRPESRNSFSTSSDDPFKVIVKQPTWRPGEAERANAQEVLKEMENIVHAATKKDSLPWINQRGLAEAAKRGPPIPKASLNPGDTRGALQVKDSNRLMQGTSDRYMFTPLDDIWIYDADHEIAQSIVPKSAEKHMTYKDSQLCQRCEELSIWSKVCEFSDKLKNLEGRSVSCELCHLLFRSMVGRVALMDEPIRFMRRDSYLTFGDRDWAPILTLCRTSDSETLSSNGIQRGFPDPLVPGDATHLKILNRWVKDCNETQHLPDRKSFIPSRLLLVGDEDTRFVRLISKPESNSGSVNYIALSHRWGKDLSTEGKFVTTTTDNIHVIASARGIDDDFLPKTFLDAVVITRRLKVKYLWIDSLCILQDNMNHGNMDSKNDWDRESKLMEEVFGSAYITIAASCAENRFQGFLKARTPRQFVTTRLDDGVQFYICEVIDNFETDVEKGELNQRGWVLQERALSRRTLHFTSSQTYWECGEGIRCETFTKTTNRKAAFLGDSNFPHSVESFKQGRQLQHYHDLYERFSSLKLTYPTDKPRAIAGLEKRLMMALKSTGGYGIFLSNLHRDLLWQRRHTGTLLRRIRFQPEERVPSWSWMAFEGEIRYMNVPFGDIERAKDISSPFEIQTGRDLGETSGLSKKTYLEATAHKLMSDNPARLILDDPERILRRPLMCVIVGTSKQNKSDPVRHYALMVAPIMDKEEDKVFERVGVAYLSEDEVSMREGTGIVRIR